MRIAGVVITCNEDFRLETWKTYHEEYCDELYKHIIVDNGSDQFFYQKLKEVFSQSIIIRSEVNTGSTGAYNMGINHALSLPEVDAILLIGNDIRISRKGVSRLYDILFSDNKYSIVAPVLLRKDSDIVESYGIKINPLNLFFDHQYQNMNLRDIDKEYVLSDSIPGAMNLARRDFYETVGLLDEELFMYAEEVDLGIRARTYHKTIIVTKQVVAWHQHLNRANSDARSPLAGFLMGRNEILIARKYFSYRIILNTILKRLYIGSKSVAGSILKSRSKAVLKYHLSFLKGVFAGIFNIKTLPLK